MKRTSKLLNCLIIGSLLMLGSKAMAQQTSGETRETWSPSVSTIQYDSLGNPYAYWDNVNNWSDGILPTELDTNGDAYAGTYVSACFSDGTPIVPAYVTNNQDAGHIYCGFGGQGEIVVTNESGLPGGVQLKAGFHDGGDWTGIGFVAGPGYLLVEPGCNFSCGNHLWIGQGSTTDVGTIIVNGGTLNVPNGQFGLGWNGSAGQSTNYCWVTNGAHLYLQQWQTQTLGGPGVDRAIGIMDIGVGSSVVASNNLTTETFSNTITLNPSVNDWNFVQTNHQILGYEGTGTVKASYNPGNNTTTIISVPAVGPQTPEFGNGPTDVVATVGGSASFTAVVTNVAVNYQWQLNGANVSNGNGVSGATASTITIANVTAAETGIYICTATNSTATQYANASTPASLSTEAFNLFPVIAINGINGDTYVTEYTTSLSGTPTWTPFATNTLGAGTQYVIDLSSPLSMAKYYQVVQTTP